jgi:hypothetical protein
MNRWHNNKHNNKKKDSGKKPFNPSRNPKVVFKKQKDQSKSAQLFEKYKDDFGDEYSLNDIIEIGYPLIETNIDIISSGKPSDILQEIHILLIELVNTGIDSKEALSHFLGVAENDFVIDELYALLENGILAISEDQKYRVTTKGEVFLQEKKFIPVTTQEDFTFYIDGFTKEIMAEAPSTTSNTANRLLSTIKVDFDFIQEEWMHINLCFTKINSGDKEIVDLANYKRSMNYRKELFQKFFVLIYYPKDNSGKKIQLKVYNNDFKLLKRQTDTISNLFASNKFLFDFSSELGEAEVYKKQFLDTSTEIKDDKLSGKYQDISTFEHKALIKDALMTAELAVYIESPWSRRATMEYIPAMDFFLRKKGTKLFISYGIDSRSQNAPHPETFAEIEKLKVKYPNRIVMISLPDHFKSKFPNRNGSHRKLLIKDFDYYIKGSYNWLSYGGNETANYAVEEGTQFFSNVKEFWRKVFEDYKFDLELLNF